MSNFPRSNSTHARRRHNIHYLQNNINNNSFNTTSLVNFDLNLPTVNFNSETNFEKLKYKEDKTVNYISQPTFYNFSTLISAPAAHFWNSAQVF